MSKAATDSKYGTLWSRDELILAFDLYCRIPFRKTKATNADVIELAKVLNRSPSSVARKLGNFGSFDPELRKRQVVGLAHASKLDREIWDEFHEDWNQLVLKAMLLREQIAPRIEEPEFVLPLGPSEKESLRKTRVHQTFFRQTVLSSYEDTCCITGLKVKECLIASHIIPWSASEKHRADPRNGLCLSATFDRLFDHGLLTIGDDFAVVVSSILVDSDDKRVAELISKFHRQPIIRPKRFMPLKAHLQWHRRHVFLD
jgi:putative restriction endonuclease